MLTALAGCILTVLAAIGFQDNLFKWWHDPHTPFITTEPPPAPNYAEPEAWATRPSPEDNPAPPAIFFVHPTTFWGRVGWNAAIDHSRSTQRLLDQYLPTYAGPFAAVGNVWAPHYRQAALFASLTVRYDARQARALAAADIMRGFRQFLSEAPPDSPIIIAGVEQGGLHVLHILSRVIDDPDIMNRLVATYIVDQAVPMELLETGPLSTLQPCREPDDVACLMAWGAVRADHEREIRRFRNRSMAWTPSDRLQITDGRNLLCVNPVLGSTTEDVAFRRMNRGAVNASGFALDDPPPPQPAQTSAQCLDGVLLIERPQSPSIREPWTWGRRYKPRRANLFYADIEADLERRIGAFNQARDRDRSPPSRLPNR